MSARHLVPATCLLLAAVLSGCGPSDPRERVLEERARWQVFQLGQWAMDDAGTITLRLRVSGPVRSSIDTLTVRIDLLDADGAPIERTWRALDLTGVQRGGPEDLVLRLRAPAGADVQGIVVDTVPAPDPDEIPHIEELRL
jgi:hypothetical protein